MVSAVWSENHSYSGRLVAVAYQILCKDCDRFSRPSGLGGIDRKHLRGGILRFDNGKRAVLNHLNGDLVADLMRGVRSSFSTGSHIPQGDPLQTWGVGLDEDVDSGHKYVSKGDTQQVGGHDDGLHF